MSEASEALKTAYGAVVDAEIPEHLQEVAFREAMRMLVPVAPPIAGVRPRVTPPPVAGGRAAKVDAPKISDDFMYDVVSRETSAERVKIESLIHLDGGVPAVSLPGVRLGKNNAEKTRVIAQILTISRGFALGEAETPVEAVRKEAIRMKSYDQANFMAHLSKIDGFVITGSGQSRRIRAKASGIQAFPGLVNRLFGEAS